MLQMSAWNVTTNVNVEDSGVHLNVKGNGDRHAGKSASDVQKSSGIAEVDLRHTVWSTSPASRKCVVCLSLKHHLTQNNLSRLVANLSNALEN